MYAIYDTFSGGWGFHHRVWGWRFTKNVAEAKLFETRKEAERAKREFYGGNVRIRVRKVKR